MDMEVQSEAGTAIILTDSRQIELQRYSMLPQNWRGVPISASRMNLLVAILENSALQTGAAYDVNVIEGTARLMAPFLVDIPDQALDAVYFRALTDKLNDPDSRPVMINAHDLCRAWNLIRADAEANKKTRDAIAAARDSHEAPRYTHISELARRDGVKLPWRTSPDDRNGTVKPVVTREPVTSTTEPGAHPLDAVPTTEQRTRESANREAWLRMAAEAEAEKSIEERTNQEEPHE